MFCKTCSVERPETEFTIEGTDRCNVCFRLGRVALATKPNDSIKVIVLKAKLRSITAESKVCPGCKDEHLISAFLSSKGKEMRFCATCRDRVILDQSTREKERLGFLGNVNYPVARCYQCGLVGDIRTCFPVAPNSETGYGHYCISRCHGKRR